MSEEEDVILSKEVLTKLASNQKPNATELLVKDILSKHHIYTTREDKCSEVWIYSEGIYVPQGRTYIQERCRKILGEAYTTYLCNQVIAKIEADSYIEQDEFFKEENVNLVPVLNGILHLKKRELLPFSSQYRFFNKLPVTYVKDAQCPSIVRFFNDVLPSNEDVQVLQEIFGYLLYREYLFEMGFIFLGSGRNGKGKTVTLMKKLLGIENCAEITLEDLEYDGFAICNLHKRMANLCGDLSRTALKNTGIFKKLTGRDLVEANRKFKTRIKFVSYAKMVFCCNELPLTYDLTTAFFNRWRIIDFPFTFLPEDELNNLPENERRNCKLRDTSIIEKISTPEEMSGLLNWAIEGLHRLMMNNNFSNSPSTEETKMKWLRKSDSCAAFVMDCVEPNLTSYIMKSDFKQKYIEYCKKHNLRVSSDKSIKHVITTMVGAIDGKPSIDGGQIYAWDGIRFKTSTSEKELRKQKNEPLW